MPDTDPAKQPAMSLDDVAKRLGVSTQTVRRLIARQQLPAFRVGKLWRVWPSDLETFIRAGASSSQDPEGEKGGLAFAVA